MSLTVKKVAKLLRRGEAGRHIDSDSGDPERQRGLYLIVRNKNSASWELRYQLDGRPRWLGLGSAREFSLPEARQRAKAARQLRRDGVDPLNAKRAKRAAEKAANTKALTFREAADRYFEQHEAKWTNASHREQFLISLKTHASALADLDVAAIDKDAVLRVLDPIWNSKTVTADRVRNRIEAVLNWCVVRGHRPPGVNPAKWTGYLDQA